MARAFTKALLERTAIYDFANNGGAAGTINLRVFFPNLTVLTGIWYKVLTTLTSGGAATVALGVTNISTTCLLGATAIAGLTSGTLARGVDLDAAPITVGSTGGQITVTIATADLTAGKILIVCDGFTPDF